MFDDDDNNNRYTHLPYREGVGILLLNKKLEVFVGKRINSKIDAWQMPQGGANEQELFKDAALRELKEETGIINVEVIAESKNWIYYDIPGYLVPKLWNGKYRGQKQKWFLLKFLGKNSEIDLDNDIPEFSDWKWVKLEELPNIIVPFKRNLYINIMEEFMDKILSLKLSKKQKSLENKKNV